MDRYVPSIGPPNARIALVGEAPGAEEAQKGEPFVGSAGYLLNDVLRAAKLERPQIFICNVCRHRPPKNEISVWFTKGEGSKQVFGKWIMPPIQQGLYELYTELARVRPNVIAVVGNTSLWALTGKWGITKWRGSVLFPRTEVEKILGYRPKVIPTYHPAAVLRIWEWRNILISDLKRVEKESWSLEYEPPQYDLTLRPTLDDVRAFIMNAWETMQRDGKVVLSADIETICNHIECIGFASSKRQAICIPFLHNYGEPYWSVQDETTIIVELRRLLTHPQCYVIGQNFNYDAQYIARWYGFVPNVRHDTIVMQSVAFPGMLSATAAATEQGKKGRKMKDKGLDFLASLFCEKYTQWKDELQDYRALPDDDMQFWTYNSKDVCITYEVAENLLRTIESFGLREVYDFQMRLWRPVLKMTLRGCRVAVHRKQDIAAMIRERINSCRMTLEQAIPPDVWPRQKTPWYDSHKQQGDIFYTLYGVKPVLRERKTKTGYKRTPSTDDEALKVIGQREPTLKPVTDTLLELSEAKALLNNFIDMTIDHDGRVRGSYDVAGTETLRFAHRKNAFGGGGNLGNLKKEEDGKL